MTDGRTPCAFCQTMTDRRVTDKFVASILDEISNLHEYIPGYAMMHMLCVQHAEDLIGRSLKYVRSKEADRRRNMEKKEKEVKRDEVVMRTVELDIPADLVEEGVRLEQLRAARVASEDQAMRKLVDKPMTQWPSNSSTSSSPGSSFKPTSSSSSFATGSSKQETSATRNVKPAAQSQWSAPESRHGGSEMYGSYPSIPWTSTLDYETDTKPRQPKSSEKSESAKQSEPRFVARNQREVVDTDSESYHGVCNGQDCSRSVTVTMAVAHDKGIGFDDLLCTYHQRVAARGRTMDRDEATSRGNSCRRGSRGPNGRGSSAQVNGK